MRPFPVFHLLQVSLFFIPATHFFLLPGAFFIASGGFLSVLYLCPIHAGTLRAPHGSGYHNPPCKGWDTLSVRNGQHMKNG